MTMPNVTPPKCAEHEWLEVDREVEDVENWHKTDRQSGRKITGSEYQKEIVIVVYRCAECGRWKGARGSLHSGKLEVRDNLDPSAAMQIILDKRRKKRRIRINNEEREKISELIKVYEVDGSLKTVDKIVAVINGDA